MKINLAIKMNNFIVFFFLTIMLTASGCLDRIDFTVDGTERETIIIQGKLILGTPSKVEAKISKLFDFTTNVTSIEVRSCVLMDEDGNTKQLVKTDRENYEAIILSDDPDIKVELNKLYKMVVETLDGRTIESSLELLADVPQPSDLGIEYFVPSDSLTSDTWFRLFLTTPKDLADGNPARVRWIIEEVTKITDAPEPLIPGRPIEPKTCYITSNHTTTKVLAADVSELEGSELKNFEIIESRIKPTYSEGTYLVVYQESLSEEAYEYWNNIASIIAKNGSMFDLPAGKIFTNFKNTEDPVEDEVYGYFYATTQKFLRIYMSPDDMGNPRFYCPPPPMVRNPPLECTDCLSVPNSTTEKPVWWIE